MRTAGDPEVVAHRREDVRGVAVRDRRIEEGEIVAHVAEGQEAVDLRGYADTDTDTDTICCARKGRNRAIEAQGQPPQSEAEAAANRKPALLCLRWLCVCIRVSAHVVCANDGHHEEVRLGRVRLQKRTRRRTRVIAQQSEEAKADETSIRVKRSSERSEPHEMQNGVENAPSCGGCASWRQASRAGRTACGRETDRKTGKRTEIRHHRGST